MEPDTLLYCAYAIAAFDLLCAVLFAALSLGMIFNHLSWLTIFAVCFGMFWLSLIVILISGIYWRNSELVRYWLMFSSVGIIMEIVLIVYAFVSETTFQIGLISNILILCLGLFVETIFAFIVYQFYQVLSKNKPCPGSGGLSTSQPRSQTCSPTCTQPCAQVRIPKRAHSEPCPNTYNNNYGSTNRRKPKTYRCNLLQSRGATSNYTCGPIAAGT